MPYFHKNLAAGGWQKLSFMEQLGNIGSEVGRAKKWQNKDEELFWGAVERALELFDLTFRDLRWRERVYEIARAKEVFSDAVLGGKEYGSNLEDLEKYFYYFALMAQNKIYGKKI